MVSSVSKRTNPKHHFRSTWSIFLVQWSFIRAIRALHLSACPNFMPGQLSHKSLPDAGWSSTSRGSSSDLVPCRYLTMMKGRSAPTQDGSRRLFSLRLCLRKRQELYHAYAPYAPVPHDSSSETKRRPLQKTCSSNK